MSCVKKFIPTFFLLLLGFNSVNGQNRELDSVYYVKITPFLDKIISLPNLSVKINLSPNNLIIPTKDSYYKQNMQEILMDKQGLFVNISQTGFVYKLDSRKDSVLKLVRVDKTMNINYNIGALTFFSQENLYSYGGYGFWKSNGHLRQFNFLDKQWDIIPLNQEILANDYKWFSSKENKLFVPFQKMMNGGLKAIPEADLKKEMDSYYLDLNQKEWFKLGVLDPRAQKLISNDIHVAGYLSVQNGIIHLINDELFYFDFIENKIYKAFNASFNQFFIRRIELLNSFEYDGRLYVYNPTASLFDIITFNKSNFELLKFPIWRRDSGKDIYVAVGLIFILLVILFIHLNNKSVQKKVAIAQLKQLKAKSISQAFMGTEISLIELLLKSSMDGKKVEIQQINHVLGIRDKNLGLQKKVRSDVINGINDKYQIITNGPIPLIVSERNEDDKRFLAYLILESEWMVIQKIISTK